MMTLQGWRSMFANELKQKFMQSGLWERYKEEWVWELAVVDMSLIEQAYEHMTECEQKVLQELLEGHLLKPLNESALIAELSQRLGRPRQQCIAVLQSFAEAGLIMLFRHPWQGNHWLMPLPIFHNWRAALLRPQDKHVLAELPEELLQHCSYAASVPLRLRLMLFVHQLSSQPPSFTKQGSLSKTTIKQLLKEQEKLGDVRPLEQAWKHWFAGSSGGVEAFMLELAGDLGLVEMNKQGIKLNQAQLGSWLKQSQQAQDDLIWQWLLQQLLQQCDRSTLLPFNDMLHSNGSWLQLQLDQPEQWQNTVALLQLFSFCGLVSYAQEHGGQAKQLYARREFAAPSYDALHVEANAELLLLPGTRPLLIWNALDAAEVISLQEVLLLRLTPVSLQGCIARGHSIDEVHSWLQGHGQAELPVLVQQLLQTAAAAIASEQVEPDKRQLPLIPLTEAEPEGLDSYYELRPLRAWGSYCSNPLGLLLQAELLDPHTVCEHLRCEDVALLTRSWQQELRRYHGSTILQIVEAAIKFGFGLYVRLDGQLRHIVPQFLEERNGKWYMTAAIYARPMHHPLEIELSSIEAIQLDVDKGKGA